MSNRYTFGRIEVRPDERQLLVDGEPAVLGARAFDLLLCLIERRDRVASKEELLQLVWPGVVVEENNLTVQVSTLRKLLGSQAVATVAGRGYRFTLAPSEAVVAPSADLDIASSPPKTDLPLPDKPSIAVLPFANLSGDAEQEYFTDGVTEDIITELSRFHSLFVIARNSTFTYKGKHVDVRTVAKELGVRYVVEGSIRKAINRIRVTAQLIDALNGSCIWAERYDRILEDIFEVQEEVTQAIVSAIAPHIETSEIARTQLTRPENLGAYEIAMRAWSIAWVAFNQADRNSRQEAIRLAKEALSIDPRCCAALRTITFAQWQHIFFGTATSSMAAINEGIDAATRAIAIDNRDHSAYQWKGFLLFNSGQPEAGLADIRHSVTLNPNDAQGLASLGFFETMAGYPRKGVEYASRALRLSPRDPMRAVILNCQAWPFFALGDYAKAVESSMSAIQEAPQMPPPRFCLVVSYVGLGEIERAKHDYRILRQQAPELVQSRLSGNSFSTDPNYRNRVTTFLRIAAGLEDPSAAEALR